MLVPDRLPQLPSRTGSDERIPTPGADTSGFRRSDTGVGPAEEKPAIRPVTVAAPAVIAASADAGDEIEPRPNAPKSFPADTTGTTPAAAAPSIALTRRSRPAEISG